MADERTLQRRDAGMVLRFHLGALNVANGGRQMGVIGDRFDLSQVARRPVERREDAGADRGEGKVRQVMTSEKARCQQVLGERCRQRRHMVVGPHEEQTAAVATRCMRPQPSCPLHNLAHQRRRLKGVRAAE